MENLDQFLKNLKSLTISSIDEKGYPFSSYAPFIKHNHKYYVYLSLMAKHSSNLTKNKIASIFFSEDEKDCLNIFAKKRVSIQCNVKKFEQNTNEEILILDLFRTKFDSEMIDTLSKMKDFYLFEFTPFYGEAVFGFGKAYNLGGDNFEKFVQRQNTGHLSHGK